MSAELLRPENIEALILSDYPTGIWARNPLGAAVWAALRAGPVKDDCGTLEMLETTTSRFQINAQSLLTEIYEAARVLVEDPRITQMRNEKRRIAAAGRISAKIPLDAPTFFPRP